MTRTESDIFCLDLRRYPIRHNLHAGISSDGHERFVDRFERVNPAISAECRQPVERLLLVRVRQRSTIAVRRDEFDVSQERTDRPQADREMLPLFGRRSLGRRWQQQIFRSSLYSPT
jgi:hypothetical protein